MAGLLFVGTCKERGESRALDILRWSAMIPAFKVTETARSKNVA